MMLLRGFGAIGALTLLLTHHAVAEPIATIPAPEINDESWVMLEIWTEVKNITLAAYFLDYSSIKNRNLCEAAKRVFDREQQMQEEKHGRQMSSYRICLSVPEARSQGYFLGAGHE